ncbi:DUF1385 domain-containing protein [Lachnospiraceae bacterium NSJ-143]|nr:DUF1385 domain-containing protein [Lachnospiraceae bacterium NSJ-143]
MRMTNIGGQAVIEGVMMRGRKMYAMAVRTPEGSLCVEKEPIDDVFNKSKVFKFPVFRGIAAFVQSLIIGVKIIMRSAKLAGMEDDEDIKPGRFEMYLQNKFGDKFADILIYFSVAVSLVFSIGLFFVLPVFLGSLFRPVLPGTWALSIVEGLIRIGIFLLYLFLISRMKEIQRVFQYHGAEHKTINCFEHDEELTVENVKKHTRLHKRCGTSFLLIVMIISMVVFFFIRTDTLWLRLISRIVLVPFVAGISYEVIKWAGRSESPIVKIVSAPGLCLQKITTAEPDAGQIEAAIAAMKGVLEDEPE